MLLIAKLIQRLSLRDEWMSVEHWWNDSGKGKRSNRFSSSDALSVINKKRTERVVLN